MTTKTVFNIGPGAIAEPSEVGGPAFALSSSDWYAIQTYVLNALSKEIMPHTEEDFKAFLGSAAPSDLSDFTPLINAYQDIFDHVTVWNDDTYPQSISLASDVIAYARQAPTYYNPILPLAEILIQNPDDEQTKEKLQAILDVLIQQADGYKTQAEEVYGKIKTFADQTAQDKITLAGTDGKGGLYAYYNEKYGTTSEEVQNLINEIEAQKIILDAANREYEHNVIVAATTPTYAWVPVLGWIAGPVVAGIYGAAATAALNKAKAASKKIDELSAELQMNINLMLSLNTTNINLSSNINSISAALPIIQKIQGVWGAISDDLGNISELIKTNIQDALPIIMDLGVEAAIVQWQAVAKEADAYRVNAYITVQTEAIA